jgi:hypothetical protein
MSRKRKHIVTDSLLASIVEFVDGHPGCTLGEIVKKVNEPAETVRPAAKQLRESGRLIMQGSRRWAKYFPGTGEVPQAPNSSEAPADSPAATYKTVQDLVNECINTMKGEYTIGQVTSKMFDRGKGAFNHVQIGDEFLKLVKEEKVEYQWKHVEGRRIFYTLTGGK